MRRLVSASIALCFAGVPAAQADLIGHWNFDDQVEDQVGTADGTANNVTFIQSGAGAASADLGKAGSFNGTNSGVTFGTASHPAAFNRGTDDFTFTGWFQAPLNTANTGNSNGNRPVFGVMDTIANGGWSLDIGRADRTYRGKLFLTVGGTSAGINVFSDARVDDNLWHWVAVVVDNGVASMFIDGVKQSTTATYATTSTATAPAAVEAGFGVNSAQTPYQGALDEFMLWDEALTGSLGANNTLTGGDLFEIWQVPEPASLAILMSSMLLCRRRSPRLN